MTVQSSSTAFSGIRGYDMSITACETLITLTELLPAELSTDSCSLAESLNHRTVTLMICYKRSSARNVSTTSVRNRAWFRMN